MSTRIIMAFMSASLLLTSSCGGQRPYGGEGDAVTALQTCNELFDKKNYEDAAGCYESVQSRYGGTAEGEAAELRRADVYFNQKEYLLAAESYRAFIKLHPTHHRLPYVYYKAGMAYLKESPKAIDRDQQYLDEAIGYFDVGLQYFPGSPYEERTREGRDEALRRLGERHLYIAKYYYKQDEFRSAIARFITVVDDYRGLKIDEEALYLLAKSYLEIEERRKAFEVAAVLKDRYSNSKYLDKLIGDLGIE